MSIFYPWYPIPGLHQFEFMEIPMNLRLKTILWEILDEKLAKLVGSQSSSTFFPKNFPTLGSECSRVNRNGHTGL